ncbi:hypothetical protein LAZ67_6002939 [Cordylochernes scorpioides]|uniref:Uncharacterized protein n=1 Tax=Cordylochernes scorpioides TaxID=51811 RepID=A0ABY6KNA6_9ARAC|nr:hypothetical protein LAZ67_6002939 [Cordylochernes scorpioides]
MTPSSLRKRGRVGLMIGFEGWRSVLIVVENILKYCNNEIILDEELMPISRRTKLRGVLQANASCCLKRSDCCLPPTPVYFLEDSRRFYELLSPVLLLISFTVLQFVSL